MPGILVKRTPGSAFFSFEVNTPPYLPKASMLLRVQASSSGALRVSRTLRDSFGDPDLGIVTDSTLGTYTFDEDAHAYYMDTEAIRVRIDKAEGSLSFTDAEGRLLLNEQYRLPCILEEHPVLLNRFHADSEITYSKSVDGVRASALDYETYEDRTAYTCRLGFEFQPDEGLYGLGSHEEGCGNLRGHVRELYQHNMKAVVPVLVSTKGWGILFNLGCMMVFHDDAEGSYIWADCADAMDYYFMAGGYRGVMRAYTRLTGTAALLPEYAFGYAQSKEKYNTADELLSIVKEYRRRGVPLDVIVQDWCSWPEGQWGYKTFDPARFPDPKALTDELHALGARMMISIWPTMQGDKNENRAEMLANGCMLGNRTTYDAFNPKGRQLYWKQACEGLFRYGVDAWWCDCSEPFESDWHGNIKPEPWERTLVNTREAKKYMDPEKLSLYSLMHSKGIYEGQRACCPEKRVLNLTRSSYAGQHRYATVTWSGDVSADWEVLRRHIPEGLNFCATGENYWSADIGAFFTSTEAEWFRRGRFDRGVDDPGYRELYVRWLQYAAFLPMMRSHGTGTPREIWRFGEKGTPWYDAIEKAIRLRSRMVPLLYSLAAENRECGIPMLRVPALMFPGDTRLTQVNDEMLLGDSILVKPVTRFMQFGPYGEVCENPDYSQAVYLPAGSGWYLAKTGELFDGGQQVTVQAPLDVIPAFIRAGSVIVTGPVRMYVTELENPVLDITVYRGADAEFTLYEDDGISCAYENGAASRIVFKWNEAGSCLTVSARRGSYSGMPEERDFSVRIAGKAPVTVHYDGSECRVTL